MNTRWFSGQAPTDSGDGGRTTGGRGRSEPLEELLGADASARVDRQLHLADLLVDLLHEADDEVDQLVLVHLLRVEVRDQEADVVALQNDSHCRVQIVQKISVDHRQTSE